MDIAEFYDADPRRRESDEHVYGDGWTDAADAHATYRLCWVADTGELYTVREPHAGGLLARYLDELRVDQAGVDELRVEIFATEPDEKALVARISGWEGEYGSADSLTWLRARLS